MANHIHKFPFPLPFPFPSLITNLRSFDFFLSVKHACGAWMSAPILVEKHVSKFVQQKVPSLNIWSVAKKPFIFFSQLVSSMLKEIIITFAGITEMINRRH